METSTSNSKLCKSKLTLSIHYIEFIPELILTVRKGIKGLHKDELVGYDGKDRFNLFNLCGRVVINGYLAKKL